jgi:hypothetical protein
LTLSGITLDLSLPIPEELITGVVVEGLRKRVLALEAELSSSNKKIKLNASKELKASNEASGSGAGSIKMDQKKQKAQLKKLFTALGKGIKAEKWKGNDKGQSSFSPSSTEILRR